MRVLVIPDPPELRETPWPNRKAAHSHDTCMSTRSGRNKQGNVNRDLDENHEINIVEADDEIVFNFHSNATEGNTNANSVNLMATTAPSRKLPHECNAKELSKVSANRLQLSLPQ